MPELHTQEKQRREPGSLHCMLVDGACSQEREGVLYPPQWLGLDGAKLMYRGERRGVNCLISEHVLQGQSWAAQLPPFSQLWTLRVQHPTLGYVGCVMGSRTHLPVLWGCGCASCMACTSGRVRIQAAHTLDAVCNGWVPHVAHMQPGEVKIRFACIM